MATLYAWTSNVKLNNSLLTIYTTTTDLNYEDRYALLDESGNLINYSWIEGKITYTVSNNLHNTPGSGNTNIEYSIEVEIYKENKTSIFSEMESDYCTFNRDSSKDIVLKNKPSTTEGKIDFIYDAYKDIKAAIEEKGGSAGSDIAEYAESIRNIKGSKDTVTYSGILGEYTSGAQAIGQDGTVYYTVPTISSGSTIGFSFEVPKGEPITFLTNGEANSEKWITNYVSNRDWNLGNIGIQQAQHSPSVGGSMDYCIYTNSDTTAKCMYDGDTDTLRVNYQYGECHTGPFVFDGLKITLKNNSEEVTFSWSDVPSPLKINYYFD